MLRMQGSVPYVLPDCRTKQSKTFRGPDNQEYEQAYCANCHKAGPIVLAENCNWMFWLCNVCETKWAPVAGTYAQPDEEFFKRVAEAQLEKKARSMTAMELLKELEDPNSTFSKIARDRAHELANRR